MAVTPARPKRQATMRDYWPIYRRFAIITTLLMQLTLAVIVGTALLISGTGPSTIAFWITIFATLIAAGGLNTILIIQLISPLKDLTNAIASEAGESPRYPLANPNIPRYEKNGFRSILQFIYERSSTKDQAPDTAGTAESRIIEDALRTTANGLIILKENGEVSYANHAAPVRKTSEGTTVLQLMFNPEHSFDEWLEHCRVHATHAQKTWLRVPDRTLGEEGRRVFNITANYEKGSAAEVVVATFDATSTYQPEDDELDFTAFAAHELRGPITVIRGYLDVLEIELGDQMADDQKELMKRLIVSANRLTSYINNILNTSKYDRRHLTLHLVESNVADIYETIRDDMALRASSQARLLAVDIPSTLPTVAVDVPSISEVMANLIDNAIKYSNEGGAVSVTASATQDFVTVSITDNGIGMPANVVGNLFHKFYRSHRSRETVAGTGIGLYICKAIVESHGGTIEVQSVENQGSTFSFTLPTYASVADKLQANDHTNAGLITSSSGWIKNHAKFKG